MKQAKHGSDPLVSHSLASPAPLHSPSLPWMPSISPRFRASISALTTAPWLVWLLMSARRCSTRPRTSRSAASRPATC